MKAAGLSLTDNKFVDELNDLNTASNGEKTSKSFKKIKLFTGSQKSKILEEWKKAEALGSKAKAEFERKTGIGFQSFIPWLRG